MIVDREQACAFEGNLTSLYPIEALRGRRQRSQRGAAEVAAYERLHETLLRNPENMLKVLAETALPLFQVETAGVSLLERCEDGSEVFRYCAIAGRYADAINQTIPRHASPCGQVLARNAPLLVRDPLTDFPIYRDFDPPIEEALLAPFYLDDLPTGTLWLVLHEPGQKFDYEDAERLQRLSRFGSISCQILRERKIAEARTARKQFLLQLNSRLRALSEPDAIQHEAACALGVHLGANRVGYAEAQDDGETVAVTRSFTHGLPRTPGRYRLADYGLATVQALRAGRTDSRPDIANDATLTAAERQAHALLQTGSAVNVPLVTDDCLAAILTVHSRDVRHWSTDEIELIQAVADLTWESLARARAEAALRASEERLRLAAEATALGTWDEDVSSRESFWNAQAYRLFGLEPEVGPTAADKWNSRLYEEDRQRVQAAYAKALASGEIYDCEHRIVRTDGMVRWIAAQGRFLFEGGAPRRFVGVFRDITEKKEAERRLSESESRLRLAEWVGGSGSYDWDVRSNVATYSEQYVALRGLTPGTRAECIESWFARVHPEDKDRVLAHVRAIHQQDARAAIEYRIRRATDGAVLWIAERREIFRDENGSPVRVIGVQSDVTAQRNAEAALRESEDRLRIALDAARAGAFDWNVETGAVHWSDGCFRLLGLDPKLTAPKHELWRSCVHPEDMEGVEAAIERALRNGERYTAEYRLRAADGVERWILAHGLVIDRPGEPKRLVGAIVDISEIRHAQEALRETDRRKDRFLAILSHELRNPLAPIRNAAQLLSLPKLSEDQLVWTRQIIQRQVKHMARLLDDLLDVARITQGKIELKLERVSLFTVVDGAIEATRSLIDAKRHRLTVNLPSEDPQLCADPVRLSQILTNLLTNAAKYTDPNGEIELRATISGSELQLRVTDNGIGIPAADIKEIFVMFSQVEGAAARSEGGLGIGLALVKGLVELHGGSVEARSSGPGLGSTFLVRLPLVATQGADDQPRDEVAAEAATRRVLVADDNGDAADTLALLLESSGYEVRVAHGGVAAVAIANVFRPHVALLDIGMPDLDGYAVARALREERWSAGLCLVALTGWGQDEDRRRAAEAGFDRHLTKPVDPQKLEQMLRDLR